MTGKYETGTEEQKDNFKLLLGSENIQDKFDLFFHWYNVVHEFGHVLVSMKGHPFTQADEEQIVNNFAVAYWRQFDMQGNLIKLEKIVYDILKRLPCPIPNDENYLDYFRDNWDKLEMTVPIYGFFQFSCVTNSLNLNKDLISILNDIGFCNLKVLEPNYTEYAITSETARDVLNDCINNISALGIDLPSIELLLVDDTDTQCCRWEK